MLGAASWLVLFFLSPSVCGVRCENDYLHGNGLYLRRGYGYLLDIGNDWGVVLMLVIGEWREQRAKTLLARLRKLERYQRDIVDSPQWKEPGVPPRYNQATRAAIRIEAQLGRIANICLREVA